MHLAVAERDVRMVRLLTQTQNNVRAGHGRVAAMRIPSDGVRDSTLMDELCLRNQLGWCALHTAAFHGQEVFVTALN